jgi:hypothetical protein
VEYVFDKTYQQLQRTSCSQSSSRKKDLGPISGLNNTGLKRERERERERIVHSKSWGMEE